MDTGAAFSILPHHPPDPATGQGLVGPSGSPIRCWGESAVKLQLAGQHFTWNFLLADVSTAILGIDLLRAHNLTVDPANCRLVKAAGHVFPTTAVTSCPTASVITGASSTTSRPALVAAGVKLPPWLPAAALSVGRKASSLSSQAFLQSPLPPATGSLAGGGHKTALRVVRCRLECRQSGTIYSTCSCCTSAGGHFFSRHSHRFCSQTHFNWQATPAFPAPSPAFQGCGELF